MTTCLNLIACSFRYMQIKSSSAFPGNLQTLTLYGHTKTAVPMYQCTNGLLLCNRPLYSSTVIGTLLHLIQRGWAWASCGPGQSPPRCTKCNNPSINGQCTYHCISVTIPLLCSFTVAIKGFSRPRCMSVFRFACLKVFVYYFALNVMIFVLYDINRFPVTWSLWLLVIPLHTYLPQHMYICMLFVLALFVSVCLFVIVVFVFYFSCCI